MPPGSANCWKKPATLPGTGHIYLATGLQAGDHKRDHDESLEVFTMPLEEAMEAVRRGEITDGKTMIALFWAEKFLSGNW